LCNTVLEFGKNVLENDKTFTPEKLAALEAEALSIRALMYFYLARTFGDVPVVTKASVTDDQDYFTEKSPQSVVLNQVLADLTIAVKNIPSTYGNNDLDKGRITKYAVWTMLADVNLWMEKYQDCVNYCDSILDSHKFGLIPGDANWFTTLYFNGNSNEGIFELQYNQYRSNTSLYNGLIPGPLQQIKASQTFADYYFPPDENNVLLTDLRYNGGSVNGNNMAIWKYIGGSSPGVLRSSSQPYANWIFYRYADVLLMKAEALNELANNSQKEVFKYINEIRVRANALNISSTKFNGDSTNVEEVAEYILSERGRELAFEGKRWFDILRYAKQGNYGKSNRFSNLIQIVTRNVPPATIVNVTNRYKDIRSHYLPINYSEILRNFKLKQNPFYEE
jgi:hypothetical protein